MARALSLAADNAGNISAAKMAIMAMTTSSLIKVKAFEDNRLRRCGCFIRQFSLTFKPLPQVNDFKICPRQLLATEKQMEGTARSVPKIQGGDEALPSVLCSVPLLTSP